MDEKARRSKEITSQAYDYEPPFGNDLQKAASLYEQAIEIDPRNVAAYHALARLYAMKLNNLEKAEDYCRRGLEVTDIPSEIWTPSAGVDAREEVADDFNHLMMTIRLKQGRIDEVKEYLNKMKAFFERHSKGNYHVAFEAFNENQQSPSAQASPASKGGCLSVVAVFFTIVILAIVSLIA